MIIPLSRGMFAVVDADDYERLAKYKWFAMKGKHTFYAVRNVRVKPNDWTSVLMHRDIIQTEQMIDHVDGDGLNNCRANLRPVTQSQNSANQRKVRGTSAFKGVSFDKNRNMWAAEIGCGGKRFKLGRFKSETEAAAAYNAKAREVFGEYGRYNEIGASA